MCFSSSFRHPSQPGKQFVDISVTVISHEQHMHIHKIFPGMAPLQLRVSGPGQNEAVRNLIRASQPFLDILDPFVEQNFFTGRAVRPCHRFSARGSIPNRLTCHWLSSSLFLKECCLGPLCLRLAMITPNHGFQPGTPGIKQRTAVRIFGIPISDAINIPVEVFLKRSKRAASLFDGAVWG